MEHDENESQFCITVEYDKESPNPENVFKGIARLLESLQFLDEQLIGCIDSEAQPTLLLEDVEKGSIKMWLRARLNNMPDDTLKTGDYKRVIGEYLVDAKYIALKWLEDKNEIESVKEVEKLEAELFLAAKNTKANQLDCYTCPQREKLLTGISQMSEAFESFRKNDVVIFTNEQGNSLIINKEFRLPKGSVEEFCTGTVLENDATVILKVRQPDFLGEASWVFKHGATQIKSKILDEEWLKRYLDGHEPISPGDSLMVRLHTVSTYDNNQNLLDEKHSIVKVIRVVPKQIIEDIPLIKDDLN